jgi:hypothetical protein
MQGCELLAYYVSARQPRCPRNHGDRIMTKAKLYLLALGLLSYASLPVPSATAQANLTWGTVSYNFDTGGNSAVAVAPTGVVVEVHRSTSTHDFWYEVGQVGTYAVAWGSSQPMNVSGSWPAVAITKDGYVIVVVSDGSFKLSSSLRYWVGYVDPSGGQNQTIQWRITDQKFDAGFHPSLSVNDDGTIVEAHESGSNGKGIYYRIGHLDNPSAGKYNIVWDSGTKGVKYDDGVNPHISINNNHQVLEVHQATASDSYLHYIRGTLNTSTIAFSDSHPRFDSNAKQPAVVLLDDGSAIETEIISANFSVSPYYRTATLDTNDQGKVNWSDAQPLPAPANSTLEYPSIASAGSNVVATWDKWITNDNELLYDLVGTISVGAAAPCAGWHCRCPR